MISKLLSNRVRRTYLGGGRIDAFTGVSALADGALRPEDWLASTTTAFNGTVEIEGEGLGRLEDGRLVRDVLGALPILVKLLDSDERLVIQAHPTVPFAQARMNSPVGKTECWYFLPGTAPDACVAGHCPRQHRQAVYVRCKYVRLNASPQSAVDGRALKRGMKGQACRDALVCSADMC